MTQVQEPRTRTAVLPVPLSPAPANTDVGRVTLVFGTQSEIIQLAPVVRALHGAVDLVYTGKPEEKNGSAHLLTEFGLSGALLDLSAAAPTRTGQIAPAVQSLDLLFGMSRPSVVVVAGESDAALAGALAAYGRGLPLVHVGAGVRSHDPRMSVEHNRIMIDHRADLLCAATARDVDNLSREGLVGDTVQNTGSTSMQAARALLPHRTERQALLQHYELEPDRYVLATIEAPEHCRDPQILRTILSELVLIAEHGTPVVLPDHPRLIATATGAGLQHVLGKLRVLQSLPYHTYLAFVAHAAVLISDNPDTLPEAAALKRPLIFFGENEASSQVVGQFARAVPPGPRISKSALSCLDNLAVVHRRLLNAPCPYGNGTAADQIASGIGALAARLSLTLSAERP